MLLPLLQCGHHVECVRAFSSTAVAHPGNHEETVRFVHLFLADCLADAFVVVDAVAGHYLLIGPALVVNQLTAAREERLQVGIVGADDVATIALFCFLDVAVVIEGLEIPLGI